ncbi:alginate lyase family protein [Catenulispora rubra]|uniref:alginate lyase family protein n=1 Tax=Catenulispora rubra TaxID=280293 RepID=UPI001E3666D7|nr:alginate lyase family protein [Catenulispora rubra]
MRSMLPVTSGTAMPRRSLLTTVAGVSGGAVLAGCGAASSQQTSPDPAAHLKPLTSGPTPTTGSSSTHAPSPTTGTTSSSPSTAQSSRSDSPTAGGHPGMLHTTADFARMAAKVAAGAQPWRAGWERLVANPHSQSGWRPRPAATVYRGSGTPENYAALYNDIHAAYQNALRWKVSGDTKHADTARDVLNAWAHTLTRVDGTADKFLAAGIYGYQFANAAEILRGYAGFDLAACQHLLQTVFYPLSSSFLARHNGAFITNYWANWDLCSMACVLAVGILNGDHAKVDEAVTYFKSGAGYGSIEHAVQFLHPGGLGQWQESGRDQGHTTLGIGLAGTICEMAWNQGVDLYGYDDSRLLKGCEYVARYNLGQDVPFTPFTWKFGAPGVWSGSKDITAVSPQARGDVRPIWEMVYNHYVARRGLAAPYTAAFAAKVRAEGGGGDYGPNSGGYDQLGFGTLAFSR